MFYALICHRGHPIDEILVSSKLVTTIVSTFTAYYIYLWPTYFPSAPLAPPYLPSFDGRAVVYPNTRVLRDYMSWRQVDCKFLCFRLRGLGLLIKDMQVISITSIILHSGLWFCKVVWPTLMRNKSWRYAHSIDLSCCGAKVDFVSGYCVFG